MIVFFLLALPVSFFWAGVLAFIPSALFLILNPLRSIGAIKAESKGIYLINEEVKLEKEKGRRIWGIYRIYGCCSGMILLFYCINWFHKGIISVIPFDILSTVGIILFFIAIISYLPFAYYLIWRKPWHYNSEVISIKKMFIFYGICLLIFALFYVYYWLREKMIIIGIRECILTFFAILISGASISYLPILFYVLKTVASAGKKQGPRPAVIFVIYSVSFLIFSSVYVADWIAMKEKNKDRYFVSLASKSIFIKDRFHA